MGQAMMNVKGGFSTKKVLPIVVLILGVSGTLLAGSGLNQGKVDHRIVALFSAMQQKMPMIGPNSALTKRSSNGTVLFDVIVHASSVDEARGLGITPNSVLANFFTARVTAEQLVRLRNPQSVKNIRRRNLR